MLRGPRVVMRDWIPEDALPFTQMNADPVVMRFFAKRLSIEESVAMLTRIREAIAKNGWGLWALEIDSEFAGFVGLGVPPYETPFTPCVEVGWRLMPKFWGNGYATEAAILAVLDGFENHSMKEIVSFTTLLNTPSQSVMRRIGMTFDSSENFDHPALAKDHRLIRHCLFRISNTPEVLSDLRHKLAAFE